MIKSDEGDNKARQIEYRVSYGAYPRQKPWNYYGTIIDLTPGFSDRMRFSTDVDAKDFFACKVLSQECDYVYLFAEDKGMILWYELWDAGIPGTVSEEEIASWLKK